MKRLATLAALAAAALMTSACITVIDGDDDDNVNWSGQNAQPFDSARDGCRETAGRNEASRAFEACMLAKGWSRG